MTDRTPPPGTDPVRVGMTGPLAPFKLGFAQELRRLGYTPRSAVTHLRLAAHLSRWLDAEGLGAGEIGPAEVGRFLADRRAAGHTHHLSARSLTPLLGHLRRLGVLASEPPVPPPTEPAEVLLCRLCRRQSRRRCCSAATGAT